MNCVLFIGCIIFTCVIVLLISPKFVKIQKKRVIIIGAGIAGLQSANNLQNSGYHVTILESKDRIGGRVLTAHLNENTPVDIGASWIHNINGNPIWKIAQENNI